MLEALSDDAAVANSGKSRSWPFRLSCPAALALVACTSATTLPTRKPNDTNPTSNPTSASSAPLAGSSETTEDAARARLEAIRATECFDEPLLEWGGLDSETSPRVDRDPTPEEQRELTRLSALEADEHAPVEARHDALGQRLRLYYDMQNWPRIARMSFEYALQPTADLELAIDYYTLAIQRMLYLERVRCNDDLYEHVDELHAIHCSPPARKAARCRELDRIFVSLRERRIVDKVMRADETNDLDGYRSAAEEYMAFLAAHCGPKAELRYDRCEEVAYNAGTLFLITNQRDRAKEMLDYLQNPKNGLHHTELAKWFPCRYDDRPMSECESR